ncbi:T9SS type A sorting domain-containing protein [Lentimicrobium sp. L6]|uniref:T9SS-dependent choice-of-anchor J family protein n=1 Tax=Lentimicrobium sp. L6 TaxID=2735916 RepID=UPI001554A9D9|nr:choice-of-anchor J domain-containing protein [Lentimicrobium sp. L6]NPD84638.1 T9SS type A sorting domain-containing protein [Lentimicrobium sp. L6]
MKKFTFVWAALLIATLGLNAQNLIENPGFETWTGGQPDTWVTAGDAITLSQNTTNVQEGSSSCQVVFTSQDNQNLQSNTFAVSAGDPIATSVYIYDNDVAGRARLSVLFEGADNYYGEYSEDMGSWQMISYEGTVPDGATTATYQIRFYDVSDNWDGDAEILVDNCSFIIDNAIKPEPTNYPTAFAAAANGAAVNASWTDSEGGQLPQFYLVMASTSANFTVPVDGTPVADDADLSDGTAVLNVAFGSQSASFSGVSPATEYFFIIFPYTNSGADIDYKTDGSAPAASLTMPDVSIIDFVDFEDNTLGDWSGINVNGAQVWEVVAYGNPGNCAKMAGYDGGAFDNEDWLVSPTYDFDTYSNITFSFDNAMNYDGPEMLFYISSDYTDDVTTATWTELAFEASPGGSWDYVNSGEIDLDSYTGTVNIAFKYTSTTSGAATWELDNLLLTGTMSSSVNEEELTAINVYPNPGNGVYNINNTQQTKLNISVYNILGELVYETISSEQLINLDIQNQNDGVYLVQLTGQGNTKTVSVIKK